MGFEVAKGNAQAIIEEALMALVPGEHHERIGDRAGDDDSGSSVCYVFLNPVPAGEFTSTPDGVALARALSERLAAIDDAEHHWFVRSLNLMFLPKRPNRPDGVDCFRIDVELGYSQKE